MSVCKTIQLFNSAIFDVSWSFNKYIQIRSSSMNELPETRLWLQMNVSVNVFRT